MDLKHPGSVGSSYNYKTKPNKLPSFIDRKLMTQVNWKFWLSKNEEVVLPLHNEFIHSFICAILNFPEKIRLKIP
jgi:hypothetical protein